MLEFIGCAESKDGVKGVVFENDGIEYGIITDRVYKHSAASAVKMIECDPVVIERIVDDIEGSSNLYIFKENELVEMLRSAIA